MELRYNLKDSGYLEHYGVLGMKWGVRRADRAQKKYEKAKAKLDKATYRAYKPGKGLSNFSRNTLGSRATNVVAVKKMKADYLKNKYSNNPKNDMRTQLNDRAYKNYRNQNIAQSTFGLLANIAVATYNSKKYPEAQSFQTKLGSQLLKDSENKARRGHDKIDKLFK